MDEPAGQQLSAETIGHDPDRLKDPEQEVLVRLRRGGQAALASEFLRHRQRLHRMVEVRLDRRLLGQVDPSEVLQEAFLEAANQLDQYLSHPPMPLFLWLRYLTGQRIVAVHQRRLGLRAEPAPSEAAAVEPMRRPQADPASLSMHLAAQLSQAARSPPSQELSARLAELIDQLEPLDREILALRHFEQLNNQEAAEELGLSPAAASHRYIQALEKLGALLKNLPGSQTTMFRSG